MRKKGIFIARLLFSFMITLMLFSMIIKTNDTYSQMFMTSFLICALASMGKTICFLFEKENWAKIFDQLFLISFFLFAFGFLFFWCYTSIKSANFVFLFFSIPFWLVSIHYFRKFLWKKTKRTNNKKKQSKWSTSIVVGTILIGFTLCCGLVLLFLGIKDFYQENHKIKNYVTTTAYFKDYQIYEQTSDGSVTYQLNYVYQVEGKEYTISTDYGTNDIPDKGSVREMKYNPNHPSEAVLLGTNRSNSMIYIGAFFTLGSFTFVLVALYTKGVFDKVKFDVIGTYIGIVFLLIGIGIVLFQNGTTGSFLETVRSFGLWIFIPLAFVIIGLFQVIKSILIIKKNRE